MQQTPYIEETNNPDILSQFTIKLVAALELVQICTPSHVFLSVTDAFLEAVAMEELTMFTQC